MFNADKSGSKPINADQEKWMGFKARWGCNSGNPTPTFALSAFIGFHPL
jgi:hypothetical protein